MYVEFCISSRAWQDILKLEKGPGRFDGSELYYAVNPQVQIMSGMSCSSSAGQW